MILIVFVATTVQPRRPRPDRPWLNIDVEVPDRAANANSMFLNCAKVRASRDQGNVLTRSGERPADQRP